MGCSIDISRDISVSVVALYVLLTRLQEALYEDLAI